MTSYLAELHSALDDAGTLVLGTDPTRLPAPLPDAVRVVVTTSGSTTGSGRPVGLSASAIRASVAATEERLGGPGQWLLTLPREHIAGLQVCARSLLAGHTPVIRGDESLAAAIARMATDTRRYTSLVPTQLVRAVEGGGDDLGALAELDGVLLGGAAVDPEVLAAARSAGVQIHTTYGSTETAGGCVYDGVPLQGVRVRIDDEARIWLGGETLAWGYLDAPNDPAFTEFGGERWFITNDLGELGERLTVLGRADDVIITGGVNVHPHAVENAVRSVPGVLDCVVVGLPSREWGSEVVAVVLPREVGELSGAEHERGREELLQQIRRRCRADLGPAAAPRALVLSARLPTLGPGKIDRHAAADLALTALAAGEGSRWQEPGPPGQA